MAGPGRLLGPIGCPSAEACRCTDPVRAPVHRPNDAAYQAGRRSPAWCKTALIRTTEVVIVGYKPGGGRREGTVGSLVLGAHDEAGRLVYVGGVGTGFTTAMLEELHRRLRSLERGTSPLATAIPPAEARGVRWVKPQLVGEVVYRTVTPDGRLRHPSCPLVRHRRRETA
jgi:bifunctional non-homologous end joining protein LigD